MVNSVAIPQDIIDNIIEVVGNDYWGPRLLKKCALVSSAFLLPSRKHLFSKIALGDNCQRLHQFLIENPVIQSFVRSIAITGDHDEPFKSHSALIASILRLSFCCLESFSISNIWQHLYWNNFSSELKDALSTIIHLPTLKHLYLEGVSMPARLFHGIHLMKLKLYSFLLDDFDSKQSRLLTSAASGGPGGVISRTVVDQCVWSFYEPVRAPTEPIFLPFMCHLRVFEIHADSNSVTISDLKILSFLMRSLRISLTSPATLEQLKFDIIFTAMNVNFFNFSDNLRDADVWSHLDSIITHPTGSRLQRVDINIRYTFRYYDDDWMEPDETEVIQPILDALPLLREKGILFIEADLIRKTPNYYY